MRTLQDEQNHYLYKQTCCIAYIAVKYHVIVVISKDKLWVQETTYLELGTIMVAMK